MEEKSAFTTIFTPNSDTELICRGLNRRKKTDDAATAEEESLNSGLRTLHVSTEMFRDVTKEIKTIRDLQELPYYKDGATTEIRFLVSSTHLIAASPVFAVMLNGNWAESRKNANNRYEIITSDWNAEALFILLNIIHHGRVADYIDFSSIVELGRVCDYYKCHKVVEVFVDKWLVPFEMDRPNTISPGLSVENIATWIFIGWAFNKEQLFNELVEVALKNCKGPLTDDSSLPPFIITRIEARRQQLMKTILDYVYAFHESLISHVDYCPQRCPTLMLGNVTKHIRRSGLKIPREEGELDGRSWVSLRQFARNIVKPTYLGQYFIQPRGPPHHCPFAMIKSESWWTETSKRVIDGCRFEDFKRLIY